GGRRLKWRESEAAVLASEEQPQVEAVPQPEHGVVHEEERHAEEFATEKRPEPASIRPHCYYAQTRDRTDDVVLQHVWRKQVGAARTPEVDACQRQQIGDEQ